MRHLRLVYSSPFATPPARQRIGEPHARAIAGERAAAANAAPSNTAREPPLDPALQALLERVRIVAPLPRLVRARALARARAVLASDSDSDSDSDSARRLDWR